MSLARTHNFPPLGRSARVSARGQGLLPGRHSDPRDPHWVLRGGGRLREGAGSRGKGPGMSDRTAGFPSLPASSGYSLSPDSSPWCPPPPAPEAAARPPWRPRAAPRRAGAHMDSAPGPAPSPPLPGSPRPSFPAHAAAWRPRGATARRARSPRLRALPPSPPAPGVGGERPALVASGNRWLLHLILHRAPRLPFFLPSLLLFLPSLPTLSTCSIRTIDVQKNA